MGKCELNKFLHVCPSASFFQKIQRTMKIKIPRKSKVLEALYKLNAARYLLPITQEANAKNKTGNQMEVNTKKNTKSKPRSGTKRVCCQSISETLNESRKRTRTFSGLFVRICTLTCCIPYILHVHDRIVVCFSNISAYFARNAESFITQGSSRKSCSLAGGFVPTRSH